MSQKLTKYFAKIPKRSVTEEVAGSKNKKLKTGQNENNSASLDDQNVSNNIDPSFESTISKIEASRNHVKILAEKFPALSVNIGLSWFNALQEEFSKEYFIKLSKFITSERNNYTIYPAEKNVYYWTNTIPIKDVKVVVLGQDPYHGFGQAHGMCQYFFDEGFLNFIAKRIYVYLCRHRSMFLTMNGLAFSVPKGIAIPPSLDNIFKELVKDVPDFKYPSHGCLYGWAVQGVLLLNTCLTVRASHANSHQGKGWEKLTDFVIQWINKNLPNTVFMLWGGNAKQKLKLITREKHLVLTSVHPSPLSVYRGFFGCQHFSKANAYLEQHNKTPINWSHLP